MMDRPNIVPESAQPAFGGIVWSDGTALWVRRGKSTLTPMQMRGMSSHLQTKEQLTEFWHRTLKDEGLAETVVDWLMPVDMRPVAMGNLLPEDEPAPPGHSGVYIDPDTFTAKMVEPAKIHEPSGLPVCHCGSGLPEYEGGCPVCYPESKKIEENARESMRSSLPHQPEYLARLDPDRQTAPPRQIVATAPVPITVATPNMTTDDVGPKWEITPPIPETAIVKRPPTPAVKEVRDEWWDDSEVMDIVKGIVGKGASDAQVAYLIQFSKALGLNPLIGETSWSTFLHKPVIDRDGYVSHANRHPQFRGLLSGIVYEGDEFEFETMQRVDENDPASPRGVVVHRRKGARDPSKIQFAYAVVYRHDREFATYYEAGMKEFMPDGYKDPSSLTYDQRKKQKFNAYPGDKLLAKCQRKAIARAFNLGALTEDDMRDGDTGE